MRETTAVQRDIRNICRLLPSLSASDVTHTSAFRQVQSRLVMSNFQCFPDPPQSVSVSISPSGVIVEGDSVTLKCISDSNPPALNFSWFKENETSAVGSGQSFSISSVP